MATIKFPQPNLKRMPYKNVIFDDWSAGMVTSVEGDNRDPRTSNLIRNFTNRYQGKLIMPHTKDTYKSDGGFLYCKKWMFVYFNDVEYVLAWMYNKTASSHTLEISPTSAFSWSNLYTMSGSDDVDYLDWTIASSDGVPVIYITYAKSDNTGDILRVSYKKQIDSIPYLDWATLYDEDTPANRAVFDKCSDSTGTSDDYGTFYVADAATVTPDCDSYVSVGDIIFIGEWAGPRGSVTSEYLTFGGVVSYFGIAQVVDVGDRYIEIMMSGIVVLCSRMVRRRVRFLAPRRVVLLVVMTPIWGSSLRKI